jgi:hypothetical protein
MFMQGSRTRAVGGRMVGGAPHAGNAGEAPARNASYDAEMQDFRREGRRRTDGDVLGGPPDSTRPANPWPRLLAFGALLVGALVLASLCFAAFVQAPPREVRVPAEQVEPGVPRLFPVTTMGADPGGFTYGAYLSVSADGTAVALLSRAPESGCQVQWHATAEAGSGRGAFVDPCSGIGYDRQGRALAADAPRDLHRLPLRVERATFVIEVWRVHLGTCRAASEGCAAPGTTEERRVPPDRPLPPDFGDR